MNQLLKQYYVKYCYHIVSNLFHWSFYIKNLLQGTLWCINATNVSEKARCRHVAFSIFIPDSQNLSLHLLILFSLLASEFSFGHKLNMERSNIGFMVKQGDQHVQVQVRPSCSCVQAVMPTFDIIIRSDWPTKHRIIFRHPC